VGKPVKADAGFRTASFIVCDPVSKKGVWVVEFKNIGLNAAELETLRPLLSEESYENLCRHRKELEQDPPVPSKGFGVYNVVYDPRNDKELQEQNKILKARIDWLRKLYAYQGMQNDYLLKTNRSLKKEIEKLKEENEELAKELKRSRIQLQSLLGVKKGAEKESTTETEEPKSKNKDKKKRGAPVGHTGHNRAIPAKVNEINQIGMPDICSHCGCNHILDSNESISKYVEDIVKITSWVTENRYQKGICCKCFHEVVAPEAFSGPQVVLGPNIISLITIMRQQMGVSYRKLSQFTTETLQISLTPSGVLGVINRVCAQFEPIYKSIELLLRNQEVLFGDETSWRMDGIRWQIWCFCNRQLSYFHADKSRGAQVAKAILGKNFAGILHADFYAAYNFVEKTQRCLVHLLKDIKEELEIVPKDKSLVQLKEGIKEIIEEGSKIKKLPPSSEKDLERKVIEKKLQQLTQLESENKKTANLIKRIDRYQDNLLRFIDHPDVEYHNNRCERTIRWMVIFRKISFGNRTPQGAYNQCVLSSCLETKRKKGGNLTEFVKFVYLADLEEIKSIIRKMLNST
jgi:Rieske Fe-S protein